MQSHPPGERLKGRPKECRCFSDPRHYAGGPGRFPVDAVLCKNRTASGAHFFHKRGLRRSFCRSQGERVQGGGVLIWGRIPIVLRFGVHTVQLKGRGVGWVAGFLASAREGGPVGPPQKNKSRGAGVTPRCRNEKLEAALCSLPPPFVPAPPAVIT